jgi:hypothetical protein
MKKEKVIKSMEEILTKLINIYKKDLPNFFTYLSINSQKESYIFQEIVSLPITKINS